MPNGSFFVTSITIVGTTIRTIIMLPLMSNLIAEMVTGAEAPMKFVIS